jgi:enediyne biosynthesis protein E4
VPHAVDRRRSRAPPSAEPVTRPLASALLALLVSSAIGGSAQQTAAPFLDVTAESGLDFTHVNGATGELFLPEVMGAGGALFDYDNDGDLDLLAVQGGALRGGARPATAAPGSRLYRNDGGRAGRGVRFTDVTERSGLVATGYGMAAATGDYDNDGWVDLYLTYLGTNRMFRNLGDGTFADVTARAGTGVSQWSASATFFDYDRDGWLDLFVTNYVRFSVDMKRACFSAGSARDYCTPSVYDPLPDSLFRNNRDGTFSDVSASAGLSRSPARGLGVLASDVDGDGWTDLYVANDGDPNQLWLNDRGSGRFKDEALLAGVAVNRMGQVQGSMGIDAGDVDGDGDEDLFVTNLDNEGNAFYRNLGKALYEERTVEAGLFARGFTGFGARWIDYDNDGWLDLVVVNGAVRHMSRQVQAGDPYPLKQRNQIFHNDRGRRFVDVTQTAGPAFASPRVGRGVATGDLDNDGDVDLVIFNNSGAAQVLLNQSSGRHWIGIRVLDGRHKRDALQTRVELVRRAGALWRRVQADGSYASSSDPRVVFGLAADGAPQTVRVHWAGGTAETFAGLRADRYWILEAGRPPRELR